VTKSRLQKTAVENSCTRAEGLYLECGSGGGFPSRALKGRPTECAAITPLQGLSRKGNILLPHPPRPLAWALLGRPFGAVGCRRRPVLSLRRRANPHLGHYPQTQDRRYNFELRQCPRRHSKAVAAATALHGAFGTPIFRAWEENAGSNRIR